jgi:tryptophan halogenase
MLGIDEAELVRVGAATHRLGTRFEHWSPDGEPWHHVHDCYGPPTAGVQLHDLWARARRSASVPAFDRCAPAAAMAAAGKFVHPDDREPLLANFGFGLRLDPDRYRQVLMALAQRLRVGRGQGEIADVERREQGGIAALRLTDGQRVDADLFIDCGGPSAPILSRIDDRYEDWSRWFPCDRLLIAREREASAPSSADVAAAVDIGWRGTVPLEDGRIVTLAYSSAHGAEGKARRALGASTEAVREAELVSVRPGRRPEPWVHNVLALGDAATALDPLEGVNLHLVHTAIQRALDLLPGRDFHPLELREYNRQSTQLVGRVRDLVAVHFVRSGRRDGALWKAMAGCTPPDSLGHTIEEFERRGRLPFYELETFDRHGWAAVMIGHGIVPRASDPMAEGVDPQESIASIRAYAERVAALPARLPPYADYLARMRAALQAAARR